MPSRKSRRGFTLIEIMVVVVIVGLLAALVGPEVWKMLGFGQEGVAQTQAKEYYDKAHFWKLKKKRFPATLRDMESPLDPDKDDSPFIPKIQEDPWGNDYMLEQVGKDIRIISWGPDGQEGTEDDIIYPERRDE